MGLPGRTESLRVFPPGPPCTPERPVASLQFLAMARAMAAVCAWIQFVAARLPGTAE